MSHGRHEGPQTALAGVPVLGSTVQMEETLQPRIAARLSAQWMQDELRACADLASLDRAGNAQEAPLADLRKEVLGTSLKKDAKDGSLATGSYAMGFFSRTRSAWGFVSESSITSSHYSDDDAEEDVQTDRRHARLRCCPNTWVAQGRDWILATTEGHFFTLLLIGALMMLSCTLSWSLAGGNSDYGSDWNDSFWISWGLFFDPGTQTNLPPSDPLKIRTLAVLFSITGFVFNLTLLGLIVEKVRGFFKYLSRMHSRISTRGHILLLGWGDKTLNLLTELIVQEQLYAMSRRSGCVCCCRRAANRDIVILAERSTTDMKQDVHMHLNFENMKSHGISYRQGNPTDRNELIKVSAPYADSILIMSSGQQVRVADQAVIQTLLALGALPGVSQLCGSIFAEMQTSQMVAVAKKILPSAEGIVARYAVNRILVLRAINPSIGFTYLELLSYRRDNEMYLIRAPRYLWGTALLDACHLYPDAVICGVVPAAGDRVEKMFVVDPDRPLQPRDSIISLARDRKAASHYTQNSKSSSEIPPNSLQSMKRLAAIDSDPVQSDGQLLLGPMVQGPKTILLIGCPTDFPNILEALECYLASGSVVHVLSPRSLEWREEAMSQYFGPAASLEDQFRRISLKHKVGNPTSLRSLNELPLSEVSCAIVLAEQLGDEAPLAVDSRNLTTVISLRSLITKAVGSRRVKVVTELLDPQTAQVIENNKGVRELGSFVYSNAVTTGVFAFAAAEKVTYDFYQDLLDPDGSTGHIWALPVRDVVIGCEELSFRELQSRMWGTCNGILLGWRRMSRRYPELNPLNKEERLLWNEELPDELIILSPGRSFSATRSRQTPHRRIHLPGTVVTE